MGRWTPLILMAGGLAILFGTVLGLNFPMGGPNGNQSANLIGSGRRSRVLPANINVNSTPNGTTPSSENSTTEAQNNNTSNESTPTPESTPDTTTNTNNSDNSDNSDTSTTTAENPSHQTNQNKEPIPALW